MIIDKKKKVTKREIDLTGPEGNAFMLLAIALYEVILDNTAIGPSNSTIIGPLFSSNNLSTEQPTEQTLGRTLTVSIIGTNVDFSTPVQVIINGSDSIGPATETGFFYDVLPKEKNFKLEDLDLKLVAGKNNEKTNSSTDG